MFAPTIFESSGIIFFPILGGDRYPQAPAGPDARFRHHAQCAISFVSEYVTFPLCNHFVRQDTASTRIAKPAVRAGALASIRLQSDYLAARPIAAAIAQVASSRCFVSTTSGQERRNPTDLGCCFNVPMRPAPRRIYWGWVSLPGVEKGGLWATSQRALLGRNLKPPAARKRVKARLQCAASCLVLRHQCDWPERCRQMRALDRPCDRGQCRDRYRHLRSWDRGRSPNRNRRAPGRGHHCDTPRLPALDSIWHRSPRSREPWGHWQLPERSLSSPQV